MSLLTSNADTTNTGKSFSPSVFFAQWQEIVIQLIYSTFGGAGAKPRQSMQSMEQFALDVEAAATSLCVEKGIPTAQLEQTEKQLRYSSSIFVPFLLTVILAGHEPSAGFNVEFVEEDHPINLDTINLVGSANSDEVSQMERFCNSRLDSGDIFLRAGDCQGEVYLLPGAGVFKPEMTQMSTTRLRSGFTGSEHRREIAAFRVDHAYGGFARVPPTAPVTICGDSLPDRDEESAGLVPGSMQKWVHSVCASEDMGSSRFNTNDVHHIGILDVLLYNTDRHGGNMLVAKSSSCATACGKGKAGLVPIDHGLCLPDFRHLSQAEFEWLYWKQGQQPFTKQDLELIASFKGDKVASILRGLGLSSGSVLTARLMVTLLHETAVKRGWTLREIGAFCTQAFTAQSSELADVVAKAAIAADMEDGDVPFEAHGVFVESFLTALTHRFDGNKITVV